MTENQEKWLVRAALVVVVGYAALILVFAILTGSLTS